MAVGFLQTPIGILRLVATQRLLTRVERVEQLGEERLNPIILEAKRQLLAYFSGELQVFTVSCRYPTGTPFQIKVWDALQRIPYGQTVTYGQLAEAIGMPKASRAVGGAVGRNPLLILVPCHRVVAKNGLGGFREGLEAKKLLLDIEHINHK